VSSIRDAARIDQLKKNFAQIVVFVNRHEDDFAASRSALIEIIPVSVDRGDHEGIISLSFNYRLLRFARHFTVI